MTALAQALSHASGTRIDVKSLRIVAMFCGAGLLVSLLFASYGLDLGPVNINGRGYIQNDIRMVAFKQLDSIFLSSDPTLLLSPDWVMPRRFAARVKLSSSATVTKYSSWRVSTNLLSLRSINTSRNVR